MAKDNGRNWYSVIAASLILAIVSWCVAVVSAGSKIVYENKTKIAVHSECIDGLEDDV